MQRVDIDPGREITARCCVLVEELLVGAPEEAERLVDCSTMLCISSRSADPPAIFSASALQRTSTTSGHLDRYSLEGAGVATATPG